MKNALDSAFFNQDLRRFGMEVRMNFDSSFMLPKQRVDEESAVLAYHSMAARCFSPD